MVERDAASAWRLRRLALPARLGLSALVGVLALGLWASAQHLVHHHENRDGEPGLSFTDVEGGYHGLDRPAPLVRALSSGHPEGLADADRELLLNWLRGERARVTQDFDSLELGELAPAEVMAERCFDCHARKAASPIAPMLEYWDDVEPLAFARQLDATPKEIVLLSMHTHALSLGVLVLVLGVLSLATRFPSAVRSLPLALAGPGLLLDLCGWLLARETAAWTWAIVGGGTLFGLGTALALGLVLAELWLPARAE